MKKLLEQYSLQKEEEIKKFWEKNKIPEKVRAKSAKNRKGFYFMDGPPYATGHIHMGTGLNKILKDIALRSKRMQSLHVFDRPGYDTHGTPIEVQIEKEIGVKRKKDIEDYGVGKFIEKCRSYATRYIDEMNEEFNDLGVWMDWENPYITLRNEYIEAIWFAFKKAEEKGLLYLDKYSVHVCPRCATSVSYNEIEYAKQTDRAVYVKFKVKGKENTFLIVWTTTPWTLPGNTGVMVHPKFLYSEIELSNGEKWVIAKDLVQGLMDAVEAGYTAKKEFRGKEMDGWEYEAPLEGFLDLPELKNAYRVILHSRYVNLEEGTGLVHTAPGHGREDYEAGKEAGLPAISPVQLNGELTKEAGKYAGKRAREVDEEIVQDLKGKGLLVYGHPFTHDYPLCWRCKTPLLMIAVPQWFFRVSGIQKKMLELNEKVEWVPGWMKERMKNWIHGIGDWPISRARYWGTPLPIWVCGECKEKVVIGSLKELGKHAKLPKELDLHKPHIDEVKFPCKKCKGEMKRVPEVMDVWFDSGVSSWGALGYPLDKKLFEKFWPADFNLEGSDQFRGWWNSQLITSTISFNKAPFKAIAVHGMVLDVEKTKMSKSKGNIVQPKDVIAKHNRDYLRYYFASVSRGEDIAFSWDAFREINRFFNVLWNSFNFIHLYLEMEPEKKISASGLKPEDKWIVSRFNSLSKEVLDAYNSYAYSKATQLVHDFLLEDFSRTYIKLIRNRVKEKPVSKTANYVTFGLMKLLAPVVPHLTEYFYRDMKQKGMKESIHFYSLPKADKKLIDKRLEKEFRLVKEIAQAVLSMREKQKKRLRWVLKELVIEAKGKPLKETTGILAQMVNVEKISFSRGKPKGKFFSEDFGEKIRLHLNVEESEELKEKWELAELVRKIQSKRKELKFNPNDTVELRLGSSDKGFVKKFGKEIEKQTNTKLREGKGKMEKNLFREFFIGLGK